MRAFVGVMTKLQLVRPLSLVVRMEDGAESQIEGLYSISDQAQSALPDSEIVALHRQGYLQAMSVLMASLVQMNRLQQLHNAQSPSKILSIELMLRD